MYKYNTMKSKKVKGGDYNMYNEMVTYLHDVYTKYYLEDASLRTLDPSKFSEDLKNKILEFANAQDSIWSPQNPVRKTSIESGNGHTDDIFEIYFLLKYPNEDPLKLIHDAWTLSRLICFFNTEDGFKYIPHDECGVASNFVEIESQTESYGSYANTGNKTPIKICFIKGEKHPDTDKLMYLCTMVQARRLTQFVPYDKLTDDEKRKDEKPWQLFQTIFKDNEKKIAKEEMNIKTEKSGKKAAKRVVYKKTNEKIKVGDHDRVVYVGARGIKYIRKKGEYVRLD